MKEKIKRILSQREKQVITDDRLTRAAVLLPLYESGGEYHLLFTKRTEIVEHHKGQISFPGGAYQEGDENFLATALRETFEEIGVKAEDVEVLGELDDTTTVTNFVMSPFVGVIPYPYDFNIFEGEVEELITVPISAFLDKNSFREGSHVHDGRVVDTYIYEVGGTVIWGATARVLKQFLDLIFGEDQKGDPLPQRDVKEPKNG